MQIIGVLSEKERKSITIDHFSMRNTVRAMTFYNYFYHRPFITFLLFMVSGLAFGVMTVNIFRLFAANWEFITTYGLMALHEGALRQTMELVLTGMLSMTVFLIFRFCEQILIDWMNSLDFSRNK